MQESEGIYYTLPAEVENGDFYSLFFVNVTGNSKNNYIVGGLGYTGIDVHLSGLAGNDTLKAADWADTLDGGQGADSMTGGFGNDTYYVDSALDMVVEGRDLIGEDWYDTFYGGVDVVYAGTNHTLSAYVENLTLTGTATNGTGNEHANTLVGGAANNNLGGLGGNDTLDGGGGNDSLYGGDGLDTVLYAASTTSVKVDLGTNTVTLPAQIDKLSSIESVVTGSGADTIIGNAAANTFRSGVGNDVLTGGAGNDSLNGEAGVDSMRGEAGNDTYYVDTSTDAVIEATAGTAGGTDIVYSRVTYTLGANVESLRMIPGSGVVNGTGNAGNNELWGTSAANTLRGLGGVDSFDSGSGADVLMGGLGNDIFKFSLPITSDPAARDRLIGGDGAIAFEKAGSVLGDRFDLSAMDANTGVTGTQHFGFGTTTGVGRLWAVNSGTDTLIRGNIDADSTVEFEIAIADGSVLAGTYAAADFILIA